MNFGLLYELQLPQPCDGREEWDTGESASHAELEGSGFDQATKRAQWAEATENTANDGDGTLLGISRRVFLDAGLECGAEALSDAGSAGWVASSDQETTHAAARAGIGALTSVFIDPAEAGKWANTRTPEAGGIGALLCSRAEAQAVYAEAAAGSVSGG